MEQVKKILNIIQVNRFENCPKIGDTTTNLSLKILYALDDQDNILQLTFKNYSQTFKQVLNRFILHSKPVQPSNSQYAIQFLKTSQLIGQNKKLQLYKNQIQDFQYIYFRIYPIETHLINKKLKSLEKNLEQSRIQYPSIYLTQNKINIHVRRPNGQIIEISISKYSSVKLLKFQICKRQKLVYDQFNLVFVGRKLADEEATLDDQGIQEQSILFIVMMVNLGCFSSTSHIHTSQIQTKQISELTVGQSILSYNEESKLCVMDQIIFIHKTFLRNYLKVTLEDNTLIQCTSNHKFMNEEGEWLSFQYKENKRQRLQKGSRIKNVHNSLLAIQSIQYVQTQQPTQFIHISTKNHHNFYLNSFLSHNMEIKIINTQNGEEILINITEMDTIQMLKIKLQAKLQIAKNQILLVLNKKQLKDSQSIADYLQDIKNCNFLQMVIHEKQIIVINRIKQRKEYKFKFSKELTVRQLKKQIQSVIDVDSDHLILILNNTQMLNKQEIGEFELHKNYNRINLIQIQEGQITQSMVRFQQSKILNIKIKQNQYLRLNYYSLKAMRVDQFIISFISNSKRCYSLHFGEFILSPWQHLKLIEEYPIFNNLQINCYVISNFDKLSFFNSLKLNEQFREQQLQLQQSYLLFCQLKIPVIREIVTNSGYFYQVRAKFKEQIPSFYKPIIYYSNSTVNKFLQSFLNKFILCQKSQIHQEKGYNFCCSLINSLSVIPPFLGDCHRLIKNIRFKQIYEKKGDTLYFQQFLSTHTNLASIDANNLKNYTLLHIKSITGKNISKISESQDQVVFVPFTYFYLKKIISHADYDEVWLIEIPSPTSFTKNIFMWVDDEPNSQQNKAISCLIDYSRYELVQLVRTDIAEFWMKEFGWIVKWKNLNIKVMSDMQRKQGEEDANVPEAGIDLIQSFHNNLGYTTPIFIYCKNVNAGKQALVSRKIESARVKKITSNQFELVDYITSP